MSDFSFIHAADIHLDGPLRSLSQYEGCPHEDLATAPRKALVNLVNLAIEEEVAFVVLAGDLFDGETNSYHSAAFANAQFSRLREAEIDVFMIYGNHDAQGVISKRLKPPDNCKVFSVDQPESKEIARLGVSIHGQGFATRAVRENLSEKYPDPSPGHFNIGLLHTNAEGGDESGHENYAPCSLDELSTFGYDYWALGHIHKRRVLSEDPWIVFPGNVQGRHVNECGAKGATLVHVSGGSVDRADHRDLDVARWTVCEINATEIASADEAITTVTDRLKAEVEEAEGRLLAARVRLTGKTDAHRELSEDQEYFDASVRSAVTDQLPDQVWVEKVQVHTSTSTDLDEMRKRDDAIGILLRGLDSPDVEVLSELSDDMKALKKKLPRNVVEGEGAVDPTDISLLKALSDDVERTILARLAVDGQE